MEALASCLRGVMNEVPMQTKYRQLPNPAHPAHPVSPHPLLQAYRIPVQDVWPVMLDAFVYLRKTGDFAGGGDVDNSEAASLTTDAKALDTCIGCLLSVCSNLRTYPGYYMYRHRTTARDIVDSLKKYTGDDGASTALTLFPILLRSEVPRETASAIRDGVVRPLIRLLEAYL